MAGSIGANRSRSPRFPSYPIKDAIVYAERIYAGVHRSAIDAQTAFRLMGFAGKSGASATALGSIRQFGLIEGVGDNTRISDLALRILEPGTPTERRDAILEAARKPEVFRSIIDRFDGRVPTSDEPVRSYLIRELGFSKRGVEECLASLRATLEMVGDFSPDSPPTQHPSEPPQEGSKLQNEPESPSHADSIRIILTRDCTVALRFNGTVTERALTHLIRHLELTKESLAED